MPNLKKAGILVLLAAAILYAGILGFLYHFLSPSKLESRFSQASRDLFGGGIQAQEFKVQYFPFFQVSSPEAAIDLPDFKAVLKGKNIRMGLKIFPLLFSKIEPSFIEIRGGELVISLASSRESLLQELVFEDVYFKITSIGSQRPVFMEMHAAYADVQDALTLKSSMVFEDVHHIVWRNMAVNGTFEMQHFIVSKLIRILNPSASFKFQEGQVGGRVEFGKNKGESELHLKGEATWNRFVYEMQDASDHLKSPPMDVDSSFELTWRPESGDLTIQNFKLQFPFMKLDVLGRLILMRDEIKELRVTASDILAEKIPVYVMPFRKNMPYHIGLSGTSKLEMSAEGSFDHLTLDANWDLTQTLLTYGRYFSKPRDFPMSFLFTMLIQNGSQAQGDFSVRLQETNFKGTLTNFQMKEFKKGQINVISNKFKLKGWEKLMPPLKNFDMDGDAKILINFVSGTDAEEASQNVVNLTIENGQLEHPDWPGIQNLNAVMDYSPYGFETKSISLVVEDSPIAGNFAIYNMEQNLNFKAAVRAKQFDFQKMLRLAATTAQLLDKEPVKEGAEAPEWAKRTQYWISKIFPQEEKLQDLEVALHYQDKKLTLDSLEFKAYDASAKLKIGLDLSEEPLKYDLTGEISRLDLAQYMEKRNSSSLFAKGLLSLNMDWAGTVTDWDHLESAFTGSGTFSISGGSFRTFDLLGAIGSQDMLGEVGLLANGQTSFDDFRGKYSLESKKLTLNDAILASPDLSVLVSGDTTFEGLMNYRLEAYFSKALTIHFLTPIFGKRENYKSKQFGPIPLLLTGPMESPELKPDRKKLEDLQEALAKKKLAKVIQDFPPEEK